MLTLLLVAGAITCTSFISGVFGMAGGMILLLVLVAMGLDVATAMALHGIAQATGNFWRLLTWRRHVRWRTILWFGVGVAVAAAAFSFVRFTPDRPVMLILLGLTPFVALVLPARLVPQADQSAGAWWCGLSSMAVTLVAGVAGPLVDAFFVRTPMDRRAIVATKAGCQFIGNLTKTVYFLVVGGAAMALDPGLLAVALTAPVLGTYLSKFVLDSMTDVNFQKSTRVVIMAVGAISILNGVGDLLA